MSALVALAKGIAYAAHAGQVDKSGHPYIEHVARVAAAVTGPDEQTVAWLHDTLEDTAVTTGLLLAAGVPDRIVRAVEAITHAPHEPAIFYYHRVLDDPLATAVKLADVADNADPARLALLDEATRERLVRKYTRAQAILTGASVS